MEHKNKIQIDEFQMNLHFMVNTKASKTDLAAITVINETSFPKFNKRTSTPTFPVSIETYRSNNTNH